MRPYLIIMITLLTITLSGCRKNEIVIYQDALDNFYQSITYGYDFLTEQLYEGEVINYVNVEKRIDRGGELKSYTWIKSQNLMYYGEELFELEETVYYFHLENHVIKETKSGYSFETMPFDAYMELDQFPRFRLDLSYLKSYNITEGKTNVLHAELNVASLEAFMSRVPEGVERAYLTIEVENNHLVYFELRLTLEMSEIIIEMIPYRETANVIIPNVE